MRKIPEDEDEDVSMISEKPRQDRIEYPSSDDDDKSILGGKRKNRAYDNEYDEACSKL